MPRRVLQVVAALIGVAALGSFALAIYNAPSRGRLPGEHAGAGGAPVIQATDATPLTEERIEGPPPPRELTPEEKAQAEADRKAKAEAEAAAKLAAAEPAPAPAIAPPAPLPVPPPPDRVGEILDSAAPPADEPPH
ncbi:MAG: hypothetical protein ABI655_13515 [Phenylobacterium sp.]